MRRNLLLLRLLLGLIFFTGVIACERESESETKEEGSGDIYLNAVKDYAEAMIMNARDKYGIIESPLFASAMNRKTLDIGRRQDFDTISGVRENDRSLGGANIMEDMAFYETLYKLSDLTGDSLYTNEANKALKYFFENCQSPSTGLMAWGEHMFWDFRGDSAGYIRADRHECSEWKLWNRSYELAPDACWNFAIGEWDHQVADKTSGDFSRHAAWSEHKPGKGSDFPRYAGQMIERWADAYSRKENATRERKEEMVRAISTLTARMEENMNTPSGHLLALRGADYIWTGSNIELARCLDEAAPKIGGNLGKRMRALAMRQDENFFKAPHCVFTNGGFAVTLQAETGEPRSRSMNKPYTIKWASGYGFGTHAATANACFKRFKQLMSDHPEEAIQYEELIMAASDQYLNTSPDSSLLIKPRAFADVIDLMLNAYNISGQDIYLERAAFFGEMGLKLFLDESSPLPKASNRHEQYETITGAPEFMYSLLNLYIAMNPEQH